MNHTNSILTFTSNYIDVGIGTRYVSKTLKEMVVIYSRLMNQYKYKYHTVFPANFYGINEDDQRKDRIGTFNNLNFNQM